jgi:hypothetical protein
MKKIEIRICKVCGKLCDDTHGSFNGKTGMCRKHNDQFKKYGKTLDTTPRTVWDPNEIRIMDGYAEIDTYTNVGEVLNTFKLDIEDIPLLQNHKWRTVFKGKQNSPYLVTGHAKNPNNNQIYFHRLVLGNPNEEIDHINRDSTDNRKENLRISYRTQQLANTKLRIDNIQGLKGVYYIARDNKYRAEIQYLNRHIYSPSYNTKAEAAYMRYLLEQFFYKDIGINNSKLMLDLIQTLTKEQKKNIDDYFRNRAKAWV